MELTMKLLNVNMYVLSRHNSRVKTLLGGNNWTATLTQARNVFADYVL